MTHVPGELDGAKVLAFAVVTPEVNATRRTVHRLGNDILKPAACLAIARYDDDAGVYLFYCDEAWQVLTDTLHDSVDKAKAQAEYEYEGISALWRTTV
jgi:hypothetical protein